LLDRPPGPTDQHAFASGRCAGLFDARRTVVDETAGKLRAVAGPSAKPEEVAGRQICDGQAHMIVFDQPGGRPAIGPLQVRNSPTTNHWSNLRILQSCLAIFRTTPHAVVFGNLRRRSNISGEKLETFEQKNALQILLEQAAAPIDNWT
jgi:hypothetical protein